MAATKILGTAALRMMDEKSTRLTKVGLFGGTFDPIHIGHLNLAVELLERCGLDEVWFCPAQISPHRQDHQAASAEHRKAMVQLAIEGHPKFRLLTVELDRDGVSYTYDTVKELSSQVPQLYLLMGADHLHSFHRWHRAEEILDLATPLIGSRSVDALSDIPGPENLVARLQAGVVETPVFDVCATDLRDRIKNKVYCEHLVHQKVLDYIYNNGLYLDALN